MYPRNEMHSSCQIDSKEMASLLKKKAAGGKVATKWNLIWEIHVLVANFKTKVRVAVLYAKKGSNDEDNTDAIDENLDSKNRDYKTVLAGDLNIDMSTARRWEFCKIMDEISDEQ
ncbi:ATP-dependent DNA helicase [Caerostris darwini]|uniref:ATP-dependent DNA helicase n=1 Tax=Caerostris darwini TaxID=1538125 RepID=A0AAV4W9J2_9ARAC|nr:ATP-dependent DNA helicase [Caerostris darwini]